MEKKSGSDAAVCHCIIDSSIFSLVVSVSWFCCTPLTNLHVDVKSPPPGPAPSAAAAFFWEAWLEHRWHIDSSDYATERPIPSEFFRPRPGESESSKSHAGAPDRRRHRTQPQPGWLDSDRDHDSDWTRNSDTAARPGAKRHTGRCRGAPAAGFLDSSGFLVPGTACRRRAPWAGGGLALTGLALLSGFLVPYEIIYDLLLFFICT